DRDLAPVVVTRRASPTAGHLRAAPSALPHAVVHDPRLLGVRRDPADPREDGLPRQPLLVRGDAVVHDRPRGGGGAAGPGPRPGAPVPNAVEHPLPRSADPTDRGDWRA